MRAERATPPTVRALQRLALVAFGATVVLSPLRGALVLDERRSGKLYDAFTNVVLSPADVAIIVALACWTAAMIAERRLPRLGSRLVWLPAAAVLGAGAVGIAGAVDPALAAYTAARLAMYAAFGVYVANSIHRVAVLIVPVALMTLTQAVIGVGQVVAQRSLSLGRWGEHVLRPDLHVSIITTRTGTRILRAYGLTDHPNILGGLLAFSLVLLVGAFVSGRTEPLRRPDLAHTALVVALAAGGACLFLTFSRGAWIATIVGLAVLVVMTVGGGRARQLSTLAVAVGVAIVGLAPFLGPYHDAVSARTDRSGTIASEAKSVDEREALASATWHVLDAHPLLGVGLGNLALAMQREVPTMHYDDQPAAIVPLDVAAETGVIGGAAFAVLLVAPWFALALDRRRWTPELAVASAVLAAVTVVGFLDYYTWSYGSGRIWLWLVLGLWTGAHRRAGTPSAAINAPEALHG